MREAVDSGRLLIVSPISAPRASASTASVRNRWILENCDEVVIGSLDPNGDLAKIIAACSTSRITQLKDNANRKS